jgi:basic membrane protein A
MRRTLQNSFWWTRTQRLQGLKKSLPIFVFTLLCASLLACTSESPESRDQDASSIEDPSLKIALIMDKGGKDDKSFNAAAFRGAKRAVEEFNVQLKDVEATDTTSIEPALRTFAERDYDLIISVGFVQKGAVEKVSKEFPDSRFAIVDAEVKQDNVRSLMFSEHQGSFLAGALAAMKAKELKPKEKVKVGFVGGMEIPLIKRFELGYKAGVKHVAKNAEIKVHYVGVTPSAWNNPTRAKELATAQLEDGVRVIFHASGASGAGVFDAVSKMENRFAIGVDSNQNDEKPGKILTSMLKRVDVAVFETIKSLEEGNYESGVHYYDLSQNGVGLAMDEHNKELVSDSMVSRLENLKQKIISGSIKVPDYYELNQKDG